jgi:hypothetical protein
MEKSISRKFEYKDGVAFSLSPHMYGTNVVGKKFKYRILSLYWKGFRLGKAKLVEESDKEIYVSDLKVNWFVRGKKLGSNIVEAINDLLTSTGKSGTLANTIQGNKSDLYERHGWKKTKAGSSSLMFNKK